MSCDLITETPPHVVLDPHRTLNPTMTAMFYDVSNLTAGSERPANKDDGMSLFLMSKIRSNMSAWTINPRVSSFSLRKTI